MPVLYETPPFVRPGTFPDTPLGVEVELLIGDTWTPITSDVKLPVSITRGMADGQQQLGPSNAPLTLNNITGTYSPRNPLGPYYGKLGRNTPVRISIPAESTHLRLANDDNSFSMTPNSTALSTAGDLDIRIDMDLADSTPATLIAKYVDSSTGRSWAITLEDDGTAAFSWWPDSATQIKAATTIPIPLGRIAFRVTLTLSSGLVEFYTAPNISGSWTPFGGALAAGATSVHKSSSQVTIGGSFGLADSGYGGAQGRIYAASIAIGGVTVASPTFTSAVVPAATLTDTQGNVWALNGTAEFSNRDYRFAGECAALPQQWSREDVWTQVSAAGVLRRVNQNNAPLDSALKRGYLRLTGAVKPIVYWPCEDLTNSDSIAAAIGDQTMYVDNSNGQIQFASNSVFLCSNAIPVVNGSAWTGLVPKHTPGPDIVVRFLMNLPTGETDGSRICRVFTSGDIREYSLTYHTGGALEIKGFDGDGNKLFDSGAFAFGIDGEFLRVSLELRTGRANNANIDYSLVTLKPGASSGLGISGTLVNASLGRVQAVSINPAGSLTSTAIGHISVQTTWESLFDLSSQLNAWRGESAGDRFSRLCTEENIPVRIYGAPNATVPMGAQSSETLFSLLQECSETDGGMMFEPMDIVGLGYRTLGSMCAQSPAVSLDYSQDHLSPPLTPTDDDQYTQNDITVTQPAGSSARAFLDDGSPMSISPPPVGVGSYSTSQTANVFRASQLEDVANWMLHLGTVNEERYPSVVVDLTDRAMSSLFYPVLDTRLGDVIAVDNLPSFLPRDGLQAIVWGQTENLSDFVCNTTMQTQPSSPYNVLVAGSGAVTDCRADTDGSYLHTAINATTTTLLVSIDSGSTRWTTDPGDMPFDIIISGERMTVTSISGSTGPQTFTVIRSVNGVVKTHAAQESVSLFSPCYVALA